MINNPPYCMSSSITLLFLSLSFARFWVDTSNAMNAQQNYKFIALYFKWFCCRKLTRRTHDDLYRHGPSSADGSKFKFPKNFWLSLGLFILVQFYFNAIIFLIRIVTYRNILENTDPTTLTCKPLLASHTTLIYRQYWLSTQ